MLLTKTTRTCHRRRAVLKKTSHMNNMLVWILDLIQENHFSMPRVCTRITTLVVKTKILRRRLLVISSCNNIVAVLDKSNNMKLRTTSTRSNLVNRVVLETPYSFNTSIKVDPARYSHKVVDLFVIIIIF